MNPLVRTVFFEEFIVRWAQGGGGTFASLHFEPVMQVVSWHMAQTIQVECSEPPGYIQCRWTSREHSTTHQGILITGAGAGGGPGPGGSFGPYEHYNNLAGWLPAYGISVLQIVWRSFGDLRAAEHDMMVCMQFAHRHELGPMITIGWSMGGAVVIEAAYQLSSSAVGKDIRGVITIGGQSHGAHNIAALGRCGIPVLILQGTADTCISPECARWMFATARQPKQLKFFDGEDHGIPTALGFLQAWIPTALGAERQVANNSRSPTSSVALPSSDMQIYVVFSGGIAPFQVCPEESISAVKHLVGHHFHLLPDRLELVFNGVTLPDGVTLLDAGVPAEGTLRMQPKG